MDEEEQWSSVCRETALSTGSFHFVLPKSMHGKSPSWNHNHQSWVFLLRTGVGTRSQVDALMQIGNFSVPLRQEVIQNLPRILKSTSVGSPYETFLQLAEKGGCF